MIIQDTDETGQVVWPPGTVDDWRPRLLAQAKHRCGQAIEAGWPLWRQQSAALGVYGPDAAGEAAAHIQACRARCDEIEAAIHAASSWPEIAAIQIDTGWPT